MKKAIFLLIVFLAGCNPKTACLLAQFPPKVIYANAQCQAPLPNYVPQAVVTGGCTGFVVTQTPAPGTLLTATNKTINVVIKATGTNGKSSQVTFTVTLADTVTPRITGLTAMQIQDSIQKKSNELYNIADNMTESLYKLADKAFPWDQYPGSGPSTQGSYDSSLFVTVSMKDLTDPVKPWKRVNTLAKYVMINPDTTYEHVTDPIAWTRITGAPDFTPTAYAIDYRDWYDWQADSEYAAIPSRNTTTVDLTKVKIDREFVPFRFNKLIGKLEYQYNNAWHQVTSN